MRRGPCPQAAAVPPSGESRESSWNSPERMSRHWSLPGRDTRPGVEQWGPRVPLRLLTSHWPTPWAMLSFYPLRDRLHRTDQYWAKRCPQHTDSYKFYSEKNSISMR